MSQLVLTQLRARREPLRVAVIGAGAMGRGLVYQLARTPGMTCVGVADLRLERAVACARQVGRPYRVAAGAAAVDAACRQGDLAVCADGALLASCGAVEVVVEATSAIAAGGRHAVTALEHGKHLALMNSEADLLFGPLLMRLAERHGVVVTSCDGDQHGVLKRLWDEVTLWGFEPVMAGNLKGFLDRYATPTTIAAEAAQRRLDHRMCTAFTDGTKLSIEMSLLANALGLRTAAPGMLGPRAAHVTEVFDRFDLPALHRAHGPTVDYLLGAEPGGGVFVIGRCDEPYQQAMLSYYKLGDGPYYLFYRPYHLCHVEAMVCLAEAALFGQALLQPSCGFRTQVIAYAKRDLRAGDTLDGVGGYACYGQIENVADAPSPGLPVGLADDVTLARDVARDERLALADLEPVDGREDFALHTRAQASAEGLPA